MHGGLFVYVMRFLFAPWNSSDPFPFQYDTVTHWSRMCSAFVHCFTWVTSCPFSLSLLLDKSRKSYACYLFVCGVCHFRVYLIFAAIWYISVTLGDIFHRRQYYSICSVSLFAVLFRLHHLSPLWTHKLVFHKQRWDVLRLWIYNYRLHYYSVNFHTFNDRIHLALDFTARRRQLRHPWRIPPIWQFRRWYIPVVHFRIRPTLGVRVFSNMFAASLPVCALPLLWWWLHLRLFFIDPHLLPCVLLHVAM